MAQPPLSYPMDAGACRGQALSPSSPKSRSIVIRQGQRSHLSKANTLSQGATLPIMENETQKRIPGRYGIEEIAANQLEACPNSNPERNNVTHLEMLALPSLCPRT